MRDVDIISMSWTIERRDQNGPELDDLEAALREAEGKNILLFCAVSDQGLSTEKSFLGKNSPGIKIGAADETGMPADFVGTPNNTVDYVLPSTYVPQASKTNPKPIALTGSSVATAFAAGLAALIIRCVQFAANNANQSRNRMDEGSDKEKAERLTKALELLKTQTGIRDAFEQFWPVKVSNTSYIEIGRVFGQVFKGINADLPEYVNKTLDNIAERLISKKQLN